MLNQRYENNGIPVLKLNQLQLKMKQQIDSKVRNGLYKFEKVPCPICNENNFNLLSNKDRYGLYVPIVICRKCGLIQTNPRMDQESYNEFYNIEYRNLYVGIEKPNDNFFRNQYSQGHKIYNFIMDNSLLINHKNMFAFEVGCGAGGILYYFKKMGWRVKGVDPGEQYINFGRNQYNLDLSVGTIDSINFDESPDLIIYSHVLEHILTPNDELQKVYNILSDTGVLYIEIPGVKNLMHSYEMDFLRLLQNAHTFHFTLRTLNNLLMKNNYEMIKGNEKINSIFKKADNKELNRKIENDYSEVLSYLNKVERNRKIFPIPLYKIKKLPRFIVIKIMKFIRIFHFVRNIIEKKLNIFH